VAVRRKGFSLVELLVTAGILVLLASILLFNASGIRARARETLAMQHGGNVAQAVRGYLSVWITDTPAALLARIAGQLPAPDWTGAPAGARTGAASSDRSCTGSFALIAPNETPTLYSWPSASREVGCVLGLRSDGNIARLRAITWVRGSGRFYVDGLSP
jgi:prepilin-type N-terminal cleavage/methylation domain-containing protein